MRSWQKRLQNNIIHAAGRVFVKGAFIPSVNLVKRTGVRFAMPTKLAKQMKRMLMT
jgi:hypothetical protein